MSLIAACEVTLEDHAHFVIQCGCASVEDVSAEYLGYTAVRVYLAEYRVLNGILWPFAVGADNDGGNIAAVKLAPDGTAAVDIVMYGSGTRFRMGVWIWS